MELINAKDLKRAQSLYQSSENDRALASIAAKLKEAVKTNFSYITVDRISAYNTDVLREAGYDVEYYTDQKEGTYYIISW